MPTETLDCNKELFDLVRKIVDNIHGLFTHFGGWDENGLGYLTGVHWSNMVVGSKRTS